MLVNCHGDRFGLRVFVLGFMVQGCMCHGDRLCVLGGLGLGVEGLRLRFEGLGDYLPDSVCHDPCGSLHMCHNQGCSFVEATGCEPL